VSKLCSRLEVAAKQLQREAGGRVRARQVILKIRVDTRVSLLERGPQCQEQSRLLERSEVAASTKKLELGARPRRGKGDGGYTFDPRPREQRVHLTIADVDARYDVRSMAFAALYGLGKDRV
jgi:hypothetical protein